MNNPFRIVVRSGTKVCTDVSYATRTTYHKACQRFLRSRRHAKVSQTAFTAVFCEVTR